MSNKKCGNPNCMVSTGICESLTFGSGELSANGYWEFPCKVCEDHYKHNVAYVWPIENLGHWELADAIYIIQRDIYKLSKSNLNWKEIRKLHPDTVDRFIALKKELDKRKKKAII